MRKTPRVTLLKQVKANDKWMPAPALFDSKGRIRRDHVRIAGRDEAHPEGSYFIEWWEGGRRVKEAVGPDAFIAAEKARNKQAELSAIRSGFIAPEPEPAVQERITVAEALDKYCEYIRYHRTLRTFRTYRPILHSFKNFCSKMYIDEIERADLARFCNALHETVAEGQEHLQQAGGALASTETTWPPKASECVRLAQLRRNCSPDLRGRRNREAILPLHAA
jgi:hypothetical protein